MTNASTWTTDPENSIGAVKQLLSSWSTKTRSQQLQIMLKMFKPSSKHRVLDVGLSPVEDLPDTNFFEKNYSYPHRITAVSVEDCRQILSAYPAIKFIQVSAGRRLPFPDKSFDIVTSWATLEHVGNYPQQQFFLSELARVGKNVFVTTPNRGCFYEPHTGLIFLHWLPLSWFRTFLRFIHQSFWANPDNFNPLWAKDVKRLTSRYQISIFTMWKIIPSHLLLTITNKHP